MLKYFYDSNGEIRFLLSKANNFKNQDAYNLYYYVKDGLGNITGLIRVKAQSGSSTVQDKTLMAEYTYDPYGKTESVTRPSGITDDIYQINPIRYKGYYYDTDSGWYNLKTRYYDPVIARFINADDVSLIMETPEGFTNKNLYAYCDNNPISRKDDNGELGHIVIGAAIGAAFEIASQMVEYGYVKHWGSIGVAAAAGGLTACFGPAAGAFISGAGSVVAEFVKGKSVKESLVAGAVSGGSSGAVAKTFKNLMYPAAKNVAKEKILNKFQKSMGSKKLIAKAKSWSKKTFSSDYQKKVFVFASSFHSGKIYFIYGAVRSTKSKR